MSIFWCKLLILGMKHLINFIIRPPVRCRLLHNCFPAIVSDDPLIAHDQWKPLMSFVKILFARNDPVGTYFALNRFADIFDTMILPVLFAGIIYVHQLLLLKHICVYFFV
ncbi:uncharacterized protein LOC110917692 [Helianthus annuus]|uniref:uncharacterized protein LOC110917692 n=1 Tax=Helianthus annuus TaxID=4232 RepID=UPI001652F6C1|nr:uncharacterized protein LOC110917692 [Helianthus annuus]